MDSDEEDEVSCEIPLNDGGGGEGGAGGSEAGSLDWSVSAISGAVDPDRFHSEVSSSVPDSPEKVRTPAVHSVSHILILARRF